MDDLTIGFLIAGVASILACCVGIYAARRIKGILRTLLVGAYVTLVLAFAVKLQGRLVLAQWLPFSNVILVGNLTTIGAAGFAGMVWGWQSVPLWRRLIFGAGMWAVAVVALLSQMPRNPPSPGDEWIDEVCMQSNHSSCSACAAATLLAYHGIRTNEAEMMKLCLTGAKGTPSLGLYRGLKLKTEGTPYDVEVFRTDLDTLLNSDESPAILLVMLEANADVDPRYQRDWGWVPGLGHAVVYYGRAGEDRVMMGDPSVGREKWSFEDLRVLWQGEGLRLRQR